MPKDRQMDKREVFTLFVRNKSRYGRGQGWPAGRPATHRRACRSAAKYGLASLHGSSPDGGVVGYSLGGGIGWYGRSLGLAANSVTAVEQVTADGSLVRADGQHEPELFWDPLMGPCRDVAPKMSANRSGSRRESRMVSASVAPVPASSSTPVTAVIDGSGRLRGSFLKGEWSSSLRRPAEKRSRWSPNPRHATSERSGMPVSCRSRTMSRRNGCSSADRPLGFGIVMYAEPPATEDFAVSV